jgi:hypothetical protein
LHEGIDRNGVEGEQQGPDGENGPDKRRLAPQGVGNHRE